LTEPPAGAILRRMEDADAPRSDRLGGLIVALILGATLVGALGWYFATNRKGIELNTAGFDVNEVAATARVPIAASGGPSRPASGMMIKSDGSMRVVGDDDASNNPKPAATAAGQDSAKQNFTQAARKHEAEVRDYAMRMTRKYASVRQYGRDWMSYPDLKKLNDDYMRNHDPVAFMAGLSRSKNFGALVAKYAGDPGLRAFVVDGIKQAPADLFAAAGGAVQNDGVMKGLISNVAQALGLPPSMTAMITGGGGTINQNQVISGIVNNPQLRGAGQQNQLPPLPAQQ